MKALNWRTGYVCCSLVYMAVMTYLGVHNFGMVHREYRRVAQQLQPARIEETARRELIQECRGSAKPVEPSRPPGNTPPVTVGDPCLSQPPAVLEKRETAVRERLEKKKRGIFGKLVLFYITFGIFFLLLPPLLVYLVLSVFIWIFKSVE